MSVNPTKKLSEVFGKTTYRIPNYQRGYSWDNDQLEDLWEDLKSLAMGRTHYTGVLTLVERDHGKDKESSWLEQHCDNYDVVDGQQRLTTIVILIQALLTEIEERAQQSEDGKVVIAGLDLDEYNHQYLYKVRADGDHSWAYRLSYESNNENNGYLRSKMFGEPDVIYTEENNYYTRKLSDALRFFKLKFETMNENELKILFDTVTNRLVFSTYVIEDVDDQYVAFETINNRSKRLSTLELLKNRLMYISTLLRNDGSNTKDRKDRQEDINKVWHEIYRQLGRSLALKLEDDDFLKDHWITRFPYTRKKGDDYRTFLLNNKFATRRALGILGTSNSETYNEDPIDSSDSVSDDSIEENIYKDLGTIVYGEIREYINSLFSFAAPWFYSYEPKADPYIDAEERSWINKLNYLRIEYFRPLVAVMLKRRDKTKLEDRIIVYRAIERFIFIAFRLCRENKNYLDSEFYRIARKFELKQSEDKKLVDLDFIAKKLNSETEMFLPGGVLKHEGYLK